ncbi:MAG: S8 family serine peptidase [Acidobacteriota bacterium]
MRRLHQRIVVFVVPILLGSSLAIAQEPQSGVDLIQQRQLRHSAGARHFILEAQHPLRPEERVELAANGCQVEQTLTNGRYLVALAANSTIDENDPRVRTLVRFGGERKLQPSAYREAAKGKAFATVRVLFDENSSIDDAREAIEAAGGSLLEPLMLEFSPNLPKRLVARVPSPAIVGLADDERVITIYGPPLPIKSDNATSALLSNVTPLFDAPYGLSGDGVQLTYFELGAADTTHPEFGGRVVVPFTGGVQGDKDHATHVAGTILAAGIDPRAKGMAPKAKLQEFDVHDSRWLTKKAGVVSSLGSVADNNSWGFKLGWDTGDSGWIWTGSDEFIAAYDDTDSAIDKIARTTGLLMVHSAGNDGDVTGPLTPPYEHQHTDDAGDPIAGEVFCYSANGSGTDCPVQCTAGIAHCEIERHPVHQPYGSLGLTAGAKNNIAVAATDSQRTIASFSSRGPARDGRIKPDIAARGIKTYSTLPGNSYGTKNGTSMSAPVVTGSTALLVEQWRKTFGGATPKAPALKSLLLAGADDVGLAGPDFTYGFGFLNTKASVDLIRADAGSGNRIRIKSLTQGQTYEVPLVLSAGQNLRVFLGWGDPEVLNLSPSDTAAKALVNDLDLQVIRPDGTTVLPYVVDGSKPEQAATRGVNTLDNDEEVEISGAAAGTYRVVVSATRISGADPAQEFVLIANGTLGEAVAPCSDSYEPNNTPETAFGNLVVSAGITPRICSASDIDYYSFRVNRSGPVSVSVTASDTAVRVTLSGGATGSVDIPAGSTKSVTASVGTGTNTVIDPTTVLVRVEATGTVGSDGSYSLIPSYKFVSPTRARSARH